MNDCACEPEAGGFLQAFLEPFVGGWLYVDSLWWTALGFAGAAVFGSRFLLQWLTSEKEKALVVPWYFWHLSFWGSCLNFLYAMHLDKAPLIAGTIALPLLYGRNLILLNRSGRGDLRQSTTDV
ncbi:MAG: lipid-A-disaccharide synthase N-terminal domain-containing protein [Lysobacterales bacterium]